MRLFLDRTESSHDRFTLLRPADYMMFILVSLITLVII